ncbi:autotransporter domain-containing protein [Psychrobacter sp. HD31]|uniref:autotransporter domain-containing protein n=1 Tax=Psychrobacter sp. HD31 TaxID=3112003 RepID=UPI003DA28C61
MRKFYKQFKPSILTTAVISISLAQTVNAQDFNNTVFFGDSLSDSGYFTNFTPYLGKFTTNPDKVWTEIVAEAYGTKAIANTPAVGKEGNNYAAGGALSSKDLVKHPSLGLPVPSAKTQVATYLNSNTPDDNTLYSVWAGANDFLGVANDPSNAPTVVATAAKDTAKTVQTLADAGAKYILVPNLPDVGKSPFGLASGNSDGATQLADYHNSTLYSALDAGSANVIPLDTFTVLQQIVANPTVYGIENTNMPVCVTPSSIVCTQNTLNPSLDPKTSIFADGVHPTGKVHEILANYALSVLNAPAGFAAVSNVAKQQGFTQDTQLHRRIDQLEIGKNSFWAEGELNDIKADDYESSSMDKNGIIGSGLAFGKKSQTGMYLQRQQGNYQAGDNVNFDLKQTGFGIYHKHHIKDYQLNLHLGIDKLDYDWEREFLLGTASNLHTADGAGRREHLSLQIGKAFSNNKLTYTPYMSALLQKTRINSLVEDNGNDATAMVFQTNEQDSMLGSLGVKANYNLNSKYDLYGNLRYSHDFKKDEQNITANLKSVNSTYTRGFDLPAAGTDANNIAVSVGVNASLTPATNLQLGVSAQGSATDNVQAGAYFGATSHF